MKTQLKLGALTLSAVLLASCSTIDNFNPFSGGGNDDVDTVDRAGRIAMVSAVTELEPDPALVATAIILPDALRVDSWSQAGRVPSKVTGHVAGGTELEVEWRWTRGEGADRNHALTVPPVAANGRIFVLDSRQTVHAIDAETGRSLWDVELESDHSRDSRSCDRMRRFAAAAVVAAATMVEDERATLLPRVSGEGRVFPPKSNPLGRC